MEIRSRKVKDVTVFDLAGDLIMGEPAQSLRARFHEELRDGARRFAVNLQEINYIDSYGIGTLLAAHTTAIKAGSKCHFFGAPARVMAILTMVRLHRVLNLFPDETSALSNLSGEERPKGM